MKYDRLSKVKYYQSLNDRYFTIQGNTDARTELVNELQAAEDKNPNSNKERWKYDPFLDKVEKWGKINIKSYEDLCNHMIEHKHAPELGGNMTTSNLLLCNLN